MRSRKPVAVGTVLKALLKKRVADPFVREEERGDSSRRFSTAKSIERWLPMNVRAQVIAQSALMDRDPAEIIAIAINLLCAVHNSSKRTLGGGR